jgi:hypothetical protein
MYSFLLRPDTLPKSYISWCVNRLLPDRGHLEFCFRTCRINTAGQIPKEVVSLNRDIVRTNTFNPMDLEHIFSRPVCPSFPLPSSHCRLLTHVSCDEDLHPGNVTVLEAWRVAHPPYGPCSGSHPHIVSCAFAPIDRFFAVFRWTLPIYGALHVVPMLLFKRKAVVRAPASMVLRAGWGSTRSAAFLATFVTIFQGAVDSQRT